MSQSPQLGYNHNIPHRGRLYHVQTEDSGLNKAHIFTHIFVDGTIIGSNKVNYDPAFDASKRDKYVIGLMQKSHKAMILKLRAGTFDEKIIALLGPHPEAAPKAGSTPAETSPASEVVNKPDPAAEELAAEKLGKRSKAESVASTPSNSTQLVEDIEDIEKVAVADTVESKSPSEPRPHLEGKSPEGATSRATRSRRMTPPPLPPSRHQAVKGESSPAFPPPPSSVRGRRAESPVIQPLVLRSATPPPLPPPPQTRRGAGPVSAPKGTPPTNRRGGPPPVELNRQPLRPGKPGPTVDPALAHPVLKTASARCTSGAPRPAARGPRRKRRAIGGIGGAGVEAGTPIQIRSRREVIVGKFAAEHQTELDEEILRLLEEEPPE